jgi:hypothetical protein
MRRHLCTDIRKTQASEATFFRDVKRRQNMEHLVTNGKDQREEMQRTET